MSKCKKCGKYRRTLKLELSICDCPLDEASRRFIEGILKEDDEKRRKK
jgi:hypothetical protein